jgi:hypothetical protein
MDALRTPVSYLLFDICRHRTSRELCPSQDGPMETRRKDQPSDGTEMLREAGRPLHESRSEILHRAEVERPLSRQVDHSSSRG